MLAKLQNLANINKDNNMHKNVCIKNLKCKIKNMLKVKIFSLKKIYIKHKNQTQEIIT